MFPLSVDIYLQRKRGKGPGRQNLSYRTIPYHPKILQSVTASSDMCTPIEQYLSRFLQSDTSVSLLVQVGREDGQKRKSPIA